MSRETIKQILIRRDKITPYEADELITSAKESMEEYLAEGDTESAHDICAEYFGLEPDYLMDLM